MMKRKRGTIMKAFIFDLDGVLCSTDEFHYLAWKQLADREGIPFDRERNNLLRGVSRRASLEIILQKSPKIYTEEEKEALCDYKNSIYVSYLDKMDPSYCYKEVRDTLSALKKKGFLLAVGSSSKNTPKILSKLEIKDLFDAVSDGNQISHSKPNPEVFLLAAKKLGLEPKECFVVEDAKSGIDAACAGGFVSIGIGEASSYKKTEHPITEFKQILNLID